MSAVSILQMLRRSPHGIVPLAYPLLQLRFMSSPKPKSMARPKEKVDKQKHSRSQKRDRKSEQQQVLQDEAKKVHCMQIAFKGDALDPEALNPERKRPPTEYTQEELDRQAVLLKEWSTLKHKQAAKMYRELTALKNSRIRAMIELKKESPFHYYQALKEELQLPIEIAPIPEFPPIEGYEPPEPHDQLFPEIKKK